MHSRLTLTAALTVAALAIGGLTLAACSGSAASTPSGAPSSAAAGTPVSSSIAPTTPSATPSSATAPAALLTPADVEKVSGLTGIKSVARDPSKGAGGQVNLATADGKLVVMANFGNGAQFDVLRSSPNYREPLSGLGDAAFVGPSKDVMKTLYIVAFRKGDHTAILATYFKGVTTATVLTMSQLKALAGIVASRL